MRKEKLLKIRCVFRWVNYGEKRPTERVSVPLKRGDGSPNNRVRNDVGAVGDIIHERKHRKNINEAYVRAWWRSRGYALV